MSNERDELAWEIFRVDNAAVPDDALRQDFPQEAEYALHIAEGLLEAGFRKPRTITTAEELDALPARSVVLDPAGLSLHKNAFTGWCASNGTKSIPLDMLQHEALPATVLNEPEASE